MRTIRLNAKSGQSIIRTGGRLEDVSGWITGNRCVIITDKNVSHFYKDSFPKGHLVEIDPGEKSK